MEKLDTWVIYFICGHLLFAVVLYVNIIWLVLRRRNKTRELHNYISNDDYLNPDVKSSKSKVEFDGELWFVLISNPN